MVGDGLVLVVFPQSAHSLHLPQSQSISVFTLYLQTSIWSTEQLSVELFMQEEIEELARPQEQLLEMHGWPGPDAWVGAGNPEKSKETSIRGSNGGHGQEDIKEGQG